MGESVNDSEQCSICLEPLSNSGEGLVSAPCAHKFHRQCLMDWIDRGVPGGYCPLCKTKVRRTEVIPLTGSPTPSIPGNSGLSSAAGSIRVDAPQVRENVRQAPGGHPRRVREYTPRFPGYGHQFPDYGPWSPGYAPRFTGYSQWYLGYGPLFPGFGSLSLGYGHQFPGYGHQVREQAARVREHIRQTLEQRLRHALRHAVRHARENGYQNRENVRQAREYGRQVRQRHAQDTLQEYRSN